MIIRIFTAIVFLSLIFASTLVRSDWVNLTGAETSPHIVKNISTLTVLTVSQFNKNKIIRVFLLIVRLVSAHALYPSISNAYYSLIISTIFLSIYPKNGLYLRRINNSVGIIRIFFSPLGEKAPIFI